MSRQLRKPRQGDPSLLIQLVSGAGGPMVRRAGGRFTPRAIEILLMVTWGFPRAAVQSATDQAT